MARAAQPLRSGLSTHPDVTVICGPIERDPDDANTATTPTVIVEILSDSTEAYDRGDKFVHYRRIASLKAYVVALTPAPPRAG